MYILSALHFMGEPTLVLKQMNKSYELLTTAKRKRNLVHIFQNNNIKYYNLSQKEKLKVNKDQEEENNYS